MTQLDASRLAAVAALRAGGVAGRALEAPGGKKQISFAEIFASSSLSRRLGNVRLAAGSASGAGQSQPPSPLKASQAARQEQIQPAETGRVDRLRSAARHKAAERAAEQAGLRADQAEGSRRDARTIGRTDQAGGAGKDAGTSSVQPGVADHTTAGSTQAPAEPVGLVPEAVAPLPATDFPNEVGTNDDHAAADPLQHITMANQAGQAAAFGTAAPVNLPAHAVGGSRTGGGEASIGGALPPAASSQHGSPQLPVQPVSADGQNSSLARGSGQPAGAAEGHDASTRPGEAGGFQSVLAGAARQRGAAARADAGVLTKAAEPVNVARPRSIDELAHVVRAQTSAGRSSMVLQLDPPELGRMRIDVRMHDQTLTLRFEAANEAGHQALRSRLGELQATLEQQGIQLNKVEVELRPPPGDPPRHEWQQGASNGGQAGFEGSHGEEGQTGQEPSGFETPGSNAFASDEVGASGETSGTTAGGRDGVDLLV